MRHLARWLWRLPVWARKLLFLATVVLWVGLVVLGFSGGLFRGPADGLTSAVCGLFVLLAIFAAVAWMLRLLGFLVSGRVPEETENTVGIPTTRTALVMPIYHEHVARVALGIERIWFSAKSSGLASTCDFFVLSDSTDPEVRLEEERACFGLLRHFEANPSGSGRLFLLRRSERTGYKASNVANFLRLHGADYKFMLVLDADSVMTGERIRRLIRKLEQRPRTALIQSLMTIYRARTLFARIMQSSQNPQSALYSAGLRWLLGPEGIYWGHNALMRIRPFAEHAMLPVYPWPAPQGGPVLSQDVHEASLLGRAGWDVDLDLDEGGSFEEMPANLLSNAERDRRWCQGDFLNLALVLSREIRTGQRMWLLYIFTGYFLSVPVIGIMLLGSIDACRRSGGDGIGAGWLVLLNIYLLQLVPKGLAWVRTVARRGTSHYGFGSFMLDTLGSVLFGPLMLYLHARIILGLLLGHARPWKSPSRRPDDAVSWSEAAAVFWPATVLGAVWIVVLAIQAPSYLAFCGPVMGVWVLSIPMAVWTSRVGLADRLARRGWMSASFSEEEALALGSLVLEADATPLSPRLTAGVAAGPIESKTTWVAEPASAEISLGQTRLRIPWVGNASTRAAEVTRGRISAQRLLLGIGMLLLLLVAALRRSFPG
jgi:membrane glycosyltransferase